MAALQCDICGGKLMGRPGGIFECDSCGMEYDTAWAKAKIQEIKGTVKVEGTVQVAGAVKVDGPVEVKGNVTVDSLLKRGWMALEDEEWESADKYFEQVLDIEPECAEAYLGKACKVNRIARRSDIGNPNLNVRTIMLEYGWRNAFFETEDFEKAYRFASDSYKEELDCYRQRNEEAYAAVVYTEAERLLAGNVYDKAQQFFEAIGDYRDAAERAKEISRLKQSYEKDIKEKLQKVRSEIAPARGLVVTEGYTIPYCISQEGRVHNVGDPAPMYAFPEDVVYKELSPIRGGLCAIRSDGKVDFTTYSEDVEKLKPWTNAKAVQGVFDFVVRLLDNGRTELILLKDHSDWNGWDEMVKSLQEVSSWRCVKSIAVGDDFVIGLQDNGSVLCAGNLKTREKEEINKWSDIVEVSAAQNHSLGLRADGSVLSTRTWDNQLADDVNDWRDIVAISTSSYHAVGLKADGSVVATGENEEGECDVSQWRDIVAIYAGDGATIGVKRDGSIVGTTMIAEECEEQSRLFDSLEDILPNRERQIARLAAEKKAHMIKNLEEEKVSLQIERSNLKGFFSGKRRKEIESRLLEIEAELEKLK